MTEYPVHTAVVGTGSAVPEKVITNFDLEQMVDTSDEWIRKRTGIVERRIAEEHLASSDLGAVASQRALEAAGLAAGDIELIICSTISPDMPFPSTSCFIAKQIGATKAAAFDLAAACSGFSYALHVADGLIRSGVYRTILAVAAETLTRYVDWTDRSTCVLFGDAAGAAVLRADRRRGIYYSKVGADSDYSDPALLGVCAGGSRKPSSLETIQNREHYIRMRGQEVFKLAIGMMPEIARKVVAEAGLTMDDIALFIPHQANIRIMEAFSERLGVPMERVFVNIDRYGNTSSATAAVALDEAVRGGFVKSGEKALIVTFGAGWTWGVNILEI